MKKPTIPKSISDQWWWKSNEKPPSVALWWELIRRNSVWQARWKAGLHPEQARESGFQGREANRMLEFFAASFNPDWTWQEVSRRFPGADLIAARNSGEITREQFWQDYPKVTGQEVHSTEWCKNPVGFLLAIEATGIPVDLGGRLSRPDAVGIWWPFYARWFRDLRPGELTAPPAFLEGLLRGTDDRLVFLVDASARPDTIAEQIKEIRKRLPFPKTKAKRGIKGSEWDWLILWDLKRLGWSLEQVRRERSETGTNITRLSTNVKTVGKMIDSLYVQQ